MTVSGNTPTDGAANARTLYRRAADILHTIRDRLQTNATRWTLLLIGIACIGYSQYLMEHRLPLGTPNPIANSWNVKYRLEIVNYDNVFHALPYFLGGAFLCLLTLAPAAWKRDFRNWAETWPKPKMQLALPLLSLVLFGYLLFQLGRHNYTGVYILLWLIVIFLLTRLFWAWDKTASVSHSLGITSADVIGMSVLLVIGFGISSFALNDIPVIIVPDEGNFWEVSRAIAIGNLHPVFFDSGVYTFPVASSILQGWMMRIFGVSFWSWRFASVIAGVLTVIPLYMLTKEWFGRIAAVTACVMMIANPYFISFSRLGYNNSQSLLPVVLAIYFFTVGTRKGSYFYLWMAGLTAGFGFYTYFAAWMGLVSLCLGVAYLWLSKEIRFRRALAVLGILLAAWGVVFLPRIAYTASGNNSKGLVFKIFETSFVNTFYGRAYYSEADLTNVSPLIPIGSQNTMFYNPTIYGKMLTRSTVRSVFALFDPFIVAEHFLNTGLAGVITPVFFLIGLMVSLRHIKQIRFGLPLLWFASGMLFLSIIGTFPPRHTHLVSVIPAMALISAVGLVAILNSLLELITSRWEWIKGLVSTILVAVVCAAIGYFGFQRYFVAMPNAYPPPFEDVASWLAWKTETPVHLIYLSEFSKPHRVEYLINTHIAPHSYTSGVIREFVPEITIVPDVPTIIFVDTQQTQGIAFIDNPPAGFHTPIQFFHHDGYSYGYALTNTDIDLQSKPGFEDGLNSLLNTPVRSVISVLMIPLLLGVLGEARKLSNWPRNDIVIEFGSNVPKAGKVEFHLRLRIPARKQDRP